MNPSAQVGATCNSPIRLRDHNKVPNGLTVLALDADFGVVDIPEHIVRTARGVRFRYVTSGLSSSLLFSSSRTGMILRTIATVAVSSHHTPSSNTTTSPILCHAFIV